MAWTKGFDPFASIWCKKCGSGDTIVGDRKVERQETFAVEDIESPDSGIRDVFDDVIEEHYTCTACGNAGDDIDDVATVSQHEAHNAFVDRMINKELKKDGIQIPRVRLGEEEDDIYYGDDPDGDY